MQDEYLGRNVRFEPVRHWGSTWSDAKLPPVWQTGRGRFESPHVSRRVPPGDDAEGNRAAPEIGDCTCQTTEVSTHKDETGQKEQRLAGGHPEGHGGEAHRPEE